MKIGLSQKKDILVIVLVPAFVTVLGFCLHLDFLTAILLFFALPCVYILWRNPSIGPKSFVFALIFGTVFYLLLDPIATINNAWYITQTIFTFRLFGIITLENYIYAITWVLFATLFYEHFFDKGQKGDKNSPRIKYAAYPLFFITILVTVTFFINQSWLIIPYFYLVAGFVLAVIPLTLFLFSFPKFIVRFFIFGAYFTFVLFLFEIVALQNGYWTFPGHFLGLVNVFGYKFPVEELFIWILVATPGLMAYYEFFGDDRK